MNAKRRIDQIKRILAEIGLEAERIEMFNLSSAMGPQFAQATMEMVERVQQLGPSPLGR